MEEEIDDDHAMHCVLWLTGQDQQALIDSLVESINRAEGYEGYTARDVQICRPFRFERNSND